MIYKTRDMLDIVEYGSVSREEVFEIFCNNADTTVYVCDGESVLCGIITRGEFKAHYYDGAYIAKSFKKITFNTAKAREAEAENLFEHFPRINQIPLVNEKGALLGAFLREERKDGIDRVFRLYKIFSNLKKKEIECFFFGRPEKKEKGEYSTKALYRMEQGLSFPVIAGDVGKYKDELEDIIGKNITAEYISDLCRIPPIIQKGDHYVHADSDSPYVNVVNGRRLTVCQPENAEQRIHIYGRCGVFGYAVEDGETIPSFLQKELNLAGLRYVVENHGLWGADDDKILSNMDQDMDGIVPGDIVIVYMAPLEGWGKEFIQNAGIPYYDCTDVIYNSTERNCFYDRPGHMSGRGYRIIARYVKEVIDFEGLSDESIKKRENRFRPLNYREKAGKGPDSGLLSGIQEYVEDIRKKYRLDFDRYRIGAIVMNANPFTLGHRYLIEHSLEQVDYLFVFIVEEDRSFFKYEDRLALVREGTKDLKNVLVEGSRQFMISSLTFPEYFLKDQLQHILLDTTMDLELFGKYIAPAFNISIRFAGDEPRDLLTRKYNENMAAILPQYGVDFQVLPRLKAGREAVSASTVRKLMKDRDFETLRTLVPESTFEYLIANFN